MELFYSKSALLKGILLSFLAVLASLFCFLFTDALGKIAGFTGGFLFGCFLITEILKLFAHIPQIVISSEGINDRRLNCGLIKWEEINSISLQQTQYSKWININLNNPETFYKKLGGFQKLLRVLNGQTGVNNFRVRLITMDKSVDEILDFVEKNFVKKNASVQN
ncbi:MAG: hypothetical protein HQM08_24505 [Candidatus Riflebacteria bacterium]|nr:hypothetical protein [Candidatus Riflebacteria bacterium]